MLTLSDPRGNVEGLWARSGRYRPSSRSNSTGCSPLCDTFGWRRRGGVSGGFGAGWGRGRGRRRTGTAVPRVTRIYVVPRYAANNNYYSARRCRAFAATRRGYAYFVSPATATTMAATVAIDTFSAGRRYGKTTATTTLLPSVCDRRVRVALCARHDGPPRVKGVGRHQAPPSRRVVSPRVATRPERTRAVPSVPRSVVAAEEKSGRDVRRYNKRRLRWVVVVKEVGKRERMRER